MVVFFNLDSSQFLLSELLSFLCQFSLHALVIELFALLGALVARPELILDVVLAILAVFRLCSTHFHVFCPFVHRNCLITPLALPWFHAAVFLVISEDTCWCLILAVLAFYPGVSVLLMVFFIALGNYLSTLRALVVLAGASELMHVELGKFDALLAIGAYLCRLF